MRATNTERQGAWLDSKFTNTNETFLQPSVCNLSKSFSEEFHKDARRQYTVGQEGEKVKRKTRQLENTENPSTLLTENHTLKPYDSSIITMNLNEMEQVKTSVQKIEDKVKSDLQSTILANGKIKAGTRTSHKFDEDVISELRKLKTILEGKPRISFR